MNTTKRPATTADQPAPPAIGARAGACSLCGSPLRSARQRAAKMCAYHLDVARPAG